MSEPKDDLVERLRELRAKATPSPWKASPYRHAVGSQVWAGEAGANAHLILSEGDADDVDAELIVALVNNLPTIIAALERADRIEAQAELIEGLRTALGSTANSILLLHQFRALAVDAMGKDGEAIRSAEKAFNSAFSRVHEARTLLASIKEPT